jgi:hypothetical protein
MTTTGMKAGQKKGKVFVRIDKLMGCVEEFEREAYNKGQIGRHLEAETFRICAEYLKSSIDGWK